MKKKTLCITLIFCGCFIFTIKGAEASKLIHTFETQQTGCTAQFKDDRHHPVHKIISSSHYGLLKLMNV